MRNEERNIEEDQKILFPIITCDWTMQKAQKAKDWPITIRGIVHTVEGDNCQELRWYPKEKNLHGANLKPNTIMASFWIEPCHPHRWYHVPWATEYWMWHHMTDLRFMGFSGGHRHGKWKKKWYYKPSNNFCFCLRIGSHLKFWGFLSKDPSKHSQKKLKETETGGIL